MAIGGDAKIAVAIESPDHYPKLFALGVYTKYHCVVVPNRHPLTRLPRLLLDDLTGHPIFTYDTGSTGRWDIDAAFAAHKLKPNIVLSVVDADLI